MYLPIEGLSADEQDLRWYFNHRPNPSGLVSSYPAMILRLLLDGADLGQPVVCTYDESGLDDRDRSQRIERILAAAGAEAEDVLWTCLTSAGARHVQHFGKVAPLIPSSAVTKAVHRQSRSQDSLEDWLADLILETTLSSNARTTVAALKAAAQATYLRAMKAYRAGKRKTGCTGREEACHE